MSTIRQQMIDLLSGQELNAMELSAALSIREREVFEHLEHIERSLAREGSRLLVEPYACLACGFIFDRRKRWNRPGRCPQCKKGHIRMAAYRIVSA